MGTSNYIECPKCKKKYHVKAGTDCPYCKGVRKGTIGQSATRIFLALVAVLVVVVFYVQYENQQREAARAEAVRVEVAKKQEAAEKKRFREKSANAQIVCNKFNIAAIVADSTISFSINTDLPDNTVVMISVDRLYWEKGNSETYAHGYFSEKSTVGQWRSKHRITIDNKKWTLSLRAHQEKLSRIGAGFDIASISDKIEISAVVPINQPDPRFGKQNSKLIGDAVTTRTSGFRIVEHDIEIDRPLASPPIDNTYRPSLYPLALDIGQTYSTSKQTPLMPSHSPADPIAALTKMKYIPAGGIFRILEIVKKEGYPWYRVSVFNQRKRQLGTGWVNSVALLGQKLKAYN